MTERYRRIEARVAKALPGFLKMAQDSKVESIVLSQGAFAVDLQDEELSLLGMAIKVAGNYGKEVRITAQKS